MHDPQETTTEPTDARGLRLAMESGYTFVNRGRYGFEQIKYILPMIEVEERPPAHHTTPTRERTHEP